MLLELVPRAERSTLFSVLSPVVALAVTLVFGLILFTALGVDPFRALYIFFIEPLTQLWSVEELIVKAAPLILIGCGLAICFRANVWNIGAEGQFTIGAIFGSAIPVLLPDASGFWVLPAMVLLGAIGGALYGLIPGFLKTRFNANEILTSLMLTYVALLLLDYLVRGPWRDPGSFNFPESRLFGDAGTLPILLGNSRLHIGVTFGLIAAVVLGIMLKFLVSGFAIRLAGEAARAARFSGFSQNSMVLAVFAISGALAGIAGISEVSGAIGQLRPEISPGYGFTAIIVAFLGRLNPLGIVVAGLVLALTYLGGEAAQVSLGLSDKVTRVFQGLLLFAVLGFDTLIHYRIRLRSRRTGAGEREETHA
jgi:ABC-type uncharacterized transport system permease subunit